MKTMEDVLTLSRQIRDLMEKQRIGYFYCKPTKYDVNSNNKRITFIDIWNDTVNLNRTDETKDDFNYRGERYCFSDLSQDRLKGLWLRLKRIKRWAETGEEKGLDKWFYAYVWIYYSSRKRDGLHFKSFVSKKEQHFPNWHTVFGYYYNPNIENKELVFFKEGFDNKYREYCYDCGESHLAAYEEHEFTLVNGKRYCKRCLEDRNYGVCDKTGAKTFRTKLIFKTAKDRIKVLKKLDIIPEKEDINIDSSILSDFGIRECRRCKSHYLYERYEYCSDCEKGIVKNYSDKNYSILKTRGEKPEVFYGFELETEVRNDVDKFLTIYHLNDKVGDLIITKYDGSLNNGFEIASNTFSFKRFMKEKDRLKESLQLATKEGCFSYDATTTGLHIHISREGFKDWKHLARFCQIWYLNKEFTRYIAQRGFASYNRWSDDIAKDKMFFYKFLNGNIFRTHEHDLRYRIVNLNNIDTVELRMFKGLLNIDYVSCSIELAEIVRLYTEQKENDITFSDLFNFILNRATKKLRGWLKIFDIQQKYGMMEV